MIATVLIPTYHRPKDLARCLEALKKQTRVPDEVLIVVRDSDAETWTLLERVSPGPLALRTVTVPVPGMVAALNTGLEAARGDVIAITDDDAAPHSDWLARIEAHFQADPKAGGVGGRDWVRHGEWVEDRAQKTVGKVQWFGRVVGNHHLGVGNPREVDILKGVNMSFRRAAVRGVRLDERLDERPGKMGSQPAAIDWFLSLAVKRAGWKLLYDPAVAVDHYPAPRVDEHGEHQRHQFSATAYGNEVHNQTLVLLEHLTPPRRLVFGFWALTVGSRDSFGLAQWLRFLPREGRQAGAKLRVALQERVGGWRTWRRSGA
jgi:cellulose synthase/poly-beta-1,6-N-acetylglucosamine synthase-like glycosyltransferase